MPTPDEFTRCHRATSEVLLRCLDKAPDAESDACWAEARQTNAACYKIVCDSYPSNADRREREKAARVEHEKREAAAAPKN